MNYKMTLRVSLVFAVCCLYFLVSLFNGGPYGLDDQDGYKINILVYRLNLLIHPDAAAAHLQLGDFLEENMYRAERPNQARQEAIKEYRKAIQLDTHYELAYFALASIYEDGFNNHRLANMLFQRCVALKPLHYTAQGCLAKTYQELGYPALAAYHFRLAAKIATENHGME